MTTEFWVYACTLTPRKEVLTALLEKALDKDLRVVVFCQNEKESEALNDYLWSFSEEKFIPHGTLADGMAEDQPIFLTHQAQVPNSADMAIVWGEAEVYLTHTFQRVIVMVDARFEAPKLTPSQEKLMQALGVDAPTLCVQTAEGKWVRQ